jgi:23S rRNA (cytosine1962-C5)-methyltransferase
MQVIVDRLTQLVDKLRSSTEIDSYRVFHGRGRTFPGLDFVTIDFFQPAIVVTLFFEPPMSWLDELIARARPLFESIPSVLVVQRRYLAGAPSDIIWGTLPDPIYAKIVVSFTFGAAAKLGFLFGYGGGQDLA